MELIKASRNETVDAMWEKMEFVSSIDQKKIPLVGDESSRLGQPSIFPHLLTLTNRRICLCKSHNVKGLTRY